MTKFRFQASPLRSSTATSTCILFLGVLFTVSLFVSALYSPPLSMSMQITVIICGPVLDTDSYFFLTWSCLSSPERSKQDRETTHLLLYISDVEAAIRLPVERLYWRLPKYWPFPPPPTPSHSLAEPAIFLFRTPTSGYVSPTEEED